MLCHSRSIIACSHILWRAYMPKCYYASTIAADALIRIINMQFCLNLSILRILHPDLRYQALTANQLKIYSHFLARSHVTPNSSKTRSMFDQHLTSVISASSSNPNLAIPPARTTSPSLPTFSQSPEYPTVNSSKLKNKNPPSKAVCYLQMQAVFQSDGHPACG
jgi:hypothetical protein